MHEEIKIGDLFDVLRRRRGFIIGMTVLGTLLICVVPVLMPPQYTAKSQILIEPQSLISDRKSVVEKSPDEAAVQTQIAALTSPALLQRVIESLKEDPAYRTAVAEESAKTDIVGEIWHTIREQLPSDTSDEPTSIEPLDQRALQRKLRVFQETGSHVVAVSVSSRSPLVASIIANRITNLYMQSEDQQKRASTERALAWVSERIPALADQWQQASAAVQSYRSEYKLAGSDPGAVTGQEIEALNRSLVQAETERAGIGARVGLMRALQRQNASPEKLLAYFDSPRIHDLTARANTLQQILAVERSTFVTGSQVPYKAQTELSEVRKQLQDEISRAIAAIDEQAGNATARVQSLKARLATLTNDDTKVKLGNLERQAAISRELYDAMLMRREELHEQRESLSPGLRLLSPAVTPKHPSSINPLLFMPPAFVLSLLVGIAGAFGKERLDRKLRGEQDVRETLNLECIGLVPRLAHLHGRHVIDHLLMAPFAPYSEAIRSLATSILPSVHAGASTILVASSVPGEGKTFFAVSLATYMASIGQRVILLDFDLRSSSVARELNGNTDRGLTDVLLNQCPIDDVIQRVPGLSLDFVAGAWRSPVDPLSILTAERLTRLVNVLRQRYQVIIIDSAPVLAVAEARLLPAIADQTLFVVAWGRMRPDIVRNAVGLVRTGVSFGHRTGLVRVVITQVDLKKHARYRYGDAEECLVEFRRYASRAKFTPKRPSGLLTTQRRPVTDRGTQNAR